MLGIILRSIWYYRRTNLIVLLAVAIATAVIGGSLIVGDSVRTSLQQMTLRRLGGMTHVLHAPRFFRQQLAADLSKSASVSNATGPAASDDTSASDDAQNVYPAIILTGSVERSPTVSSRLRASSVTILGVTSETWGLLEKSSEIPQPSPAGIVLGYRTATELEASAGDEVSLWIERPSSIPRDSLLGEREDVNLEIVLKVEAVLPEDAGASRFSLNPAQQLPHNAFVSLSTLQERLGVQQVAATRRNPVEKPARVNALIAGSSQASAGVAPLSVAAAFSGSAARVSGMVSRDLSVQDQLTADLKKAVQLEDIGLLLRAVKDRGYLSAESDSMILSESIADAVQQAAKSLGMESVPTLVYLINEIRFASDDTNTNTDKGTAEEQKKDGENGADAGSKRYSMYSIVAGLPFDRLSPLGPFLLNDESPVPVLKDDEIILSHWLSQDLQAGLGNVVAARWHEVGSDGNLPEIHRRFTVRGILKESDPISIDQDLTPFVDGVTNVNSFSDWDQPFRMEMDRITSRDDDYWDERRATPKAFVSFDTAQKLWQSRFGKMTSIRIAPSGALLNEEQLQTLSSRLSADILKAINPVDAGLGFRPIRAEGLRASSGANDFTQLFLGFSFFLILSAILLASLMFRLGIQRRLSQAGLLGALGFPERRILWFFLSEGLLVSLGGCIVGMFAAVGFAQLMIHGLTTWWIGAIGTTFLHPDVQPLKLIIAAMISLAMSIAVIHRSLTLSTRRTVRDLLSGSQDSENVDRRSGTLRRTVGGLMFPATLLVAVGLPWALIAGVIPSGEAFGGMSWRIVCFFLSGFSWLACGLLFLSRTLKKRNKEILETSPINGIFSLAMANAARRPERSLLTTALIAFATFVIVAVGAGRRNPVTELPDIRSGNGGFTLVAESSQPILGDLNSTEGREKLGLNRDPATTLPQKTYVYGFSMKPGQDASCLNLYQATVPTLLGATPEFMRRGGFRFADTPGAEPWKNIEQVLPDENGRPVIPVIGDMNTLQFSLKKGIGGTIAGPDPENPEFYLKIVGMLDSSIFQGVLVCSDSNLKRIAPEVFGQRYFLAETPSDSATIRKAAEALETALSSWGVDTEPVNQRLASFLAVQNTYLSTFQILGGLGLLVGTFGLTVVMMRNVMERRREIALMKALGFRTIRIIRLILTENCVLLFWGIVTGSASALIAMLPHLLSTGADVPWVELAITLGIVALAGTLASAFPVRAAAGTSIRENLAAG